MPIANAIALNGNEPLNAPEIGWSPMKIYHNPRCSKSRQALSILEQAGIDFEVVEYLKNPPSAAELDRLLTRLGMQPVDLMRHKDPLFKQLGLEERNLNRKEALQVLVEHPSLLERPIVDDGARAVVARPPERANDLLKGSA